MQCVLPDLHRILYEEPSSSSTTVPDKLYNLLRNNLRLTQMFTKNTIFEQSKIFRKILRIDQ